MIITLKGANFKDSNIGTLTTWPIMINLGNGATSSNSITFVDKEPVTSYTTTITIADEYRLDGSVTVTMHGQKLENAATINGKEITIFIGGVTGPVVINVPTADINEPVAPTQYTLTINADQQDAIISLVASGYTQNGNSITVNSGTSVSWSVSKSGYATQSGIWNATADETKNITLLKDGDVVQLTSSNAAFTTIDYHLAATNPGGPLVTSTQGTKGVMAWDIPAKALVTLTCSPNGNYGMAMTNSDGTIALETLVNSSVAIDGQNGTYTFSPVLEASRLYVSTAKFVSASYVILSDEELQQYDFNVTFEFTSNRDDAKYINTSQTVGTDVKLADMGGTQYAISHTIPANSVITLNVKTGGSYGMCIADENGKVLQNNPSGKADADGNIVFDKQSVPCKLWVSMTKYNKATYKLGG